MASRAKQPAAPRQKQTVQVRTEMNFGGDKVRMTSRGCFLRDRTPEISCCKCFAVQVKDIKANGCQTTVEGLNEKLKHDVIAKDLKKMLRCDGEVVKKEDGVVIRLKTERKDEVKEFLWKAGLAAKDNIK